MNREKMGRDKTENGKKSKIIDITVKPIIKEKQTNVIITFKVYLDLIIVQMYLTVNLIITFVFRLNLLKKK